MPVWGGAPQRVQGRALDLSFQHLLTHASEVNTPVTPNYTEQYRSWISRSASNARAVASCTITPWSIT